MAGNLSSRFGLPALIGFLVLGMATGSDGPEAIAFDNYPLAQMIGVACLVFILFSGGLIPVGSWCEDQFVRPSCSRRLGSGSVPPLLQEQLS